MTFIFRLFLLMLAFLNVFSLPEDCSNVNCSSYKFTVNSHTHVFQECRFKLRNKHKYKTTIEVYTYADRILQDYDISVPSKHCRGGRQFCLTKSPNVEELKKNPVLLPLDDYRNCCAKKVLDKCYYKVVLYKNCKVYSADNVKVVDTVDYLEIVYRNDAKNKEVLAKFDPTVGVLICENNFNGKTAIMDITSGEGIKACGDSDVDVTMQSKGRGIIKIIRWQCNGQYVTMLSKAFGKVKFIMRTVVDGIIVDRYAGKGKGKTRIAPVLAHTSAGACGKLTSSVNIAP